MHSACTTFANGINPFNPATQANTMPSPSKPARKNATRLHDEVYSTDYKPSVPRAAQEAPKAEAPKVQAQAVALDDDGITITNDPVPARRAFTFYKYHAKFDAMKMGQGLRVPTANVGMVAASLRKYIDIRGLKAHVKCKPQYCEDVGFGRVWLLDGVSKMAKREKSKA